MGNTHCSMPSYDDWDKHYLAFLIFSYISIYTGYCPNEFLIRTYSPFQRRVSCTLQPSTTSCTSAIRGFVSASPLLTSPTNWNVSWRPVEWCRTFRRTNTEDWWGSVPSGRRRRRVTGRRVTPCPSTQRSTSWSTIRASTYRWSRLPHTSTTMEDCISPLSGGDQPNNSCQCVIFHWLINSSCCAAVLASNNNRAV